MSLSNLLREILRWIDPKYSMLILLVSYFHNVLKVDSLQLCGCGGHLLLIVVVDEAVVAVRLWTDERLITIDTPRLKEIYYQPKPSEK